MCSDADPDPDPDQDSLPPAARFRQAVLNLRGQRCGEVVGGGPMGAAIQLLFEPVVMRTLRRSEGSTIDFEHSDVTLALDWAAWRLERNGAVVCSSTSAAGLGSHMDLGIRHLVGRRVVSVHLAEVSLDLDLTFDGGVALHIFCDQTNRDEPHDNYSLGFGSDWFEVRCESVLTCEPAG